MTEYINFSGFVDYFKAFEDDELIWTVIGTIFFIIAAISFIPETMEMLVQGTNYGLSLSFMFGNSVGQWLLVINFLCLNYEEFLGFFGYSFKKCYPALLVFIELLTQWILFLPCIYLTIIVDDREHERELTKKQVIFNRIVCIGLAVLNIVGSIGLLLLWAVLGTKIGFNAEAIKAIGDVCGYTSLIIEILQYIPQYITTIKLRDNGSLSLLMLEIQGPSCLANGLYMAIARHESFSTYATSIADAASQIGLLIICLFFKLCKIIEKKDPDYENLSAVLLQPILPAV